MRHSRDSAAYRVFSILNHGILALLAASCLLPILHLLAMSLSANHYAESNLVGLWPKGTTLNSYAYILTNRQFLRSGTISGMRAVLGTSLNLFMTIIMAYPLSKTAKEFRGRNLYMAIVLFSMVFSGGLIPIYMLVRSLNLFDTIWALVLPTAVPTFYVVLMMNFFRGLPKDIEEAARVDGASYIRSLLSIVLPMSSAVLATIALFSFVGHWNAWFDGQIFNNRVENYPLQSYLQVLITRRVPQGIDESIISRGVGQRTLTSAQIFVAMTPLLAIYPFLQRYFVKGVVVGSVKG